MPTDGAAKPQSQPKLACIFRKKFIWHSPLYGFGGHSGGVKLLCAAYSLAASIGDSNATSNRFFVY